MRGGQYQVLLLLDGLRKKGHRPVLLAREGARLWEAAENAGHHVATASLQNVWRWSQRSALVHAHDARSHTLAAVASRRPVVVSRRVAFPVKRTLLSRWKYRRAAVYLAVSEYVAGELRKASVPAAKIKVVYDGVAPGPLAEDWDPTYPVVALQSADPGKMGTLLAKAAAMAGVGIAFSRDLPVALRRASGFVYLSRSEGLGSAALLAMSMGVPVIASRVAGLAEVFVDGSSGLYVPNDAGEIAKSIRTLLSDPQLAIRLREGGIARVAQLFSAERMISDTLHVYERALG